MFHTEVKLIEVVVGVEGLREGLFIGHQWWFTGEIFSTAEKYLPLLSTCSGLPSVELATAIARAYPSLPGE